jgi:hypothetical protein
VSKNSAENELRDRQKFGRHLELLPFLSERLRLFLAMNEKTKSTAKRYNISLWYFVYCWLETAFTNGSKI